MLILLLPAFSASAPGEALFTRGWSIEEGLGPVFNDNSCAACHHQGGPGGAGDNTHNVTLLPQHGVVHAFGVDPGYVDVRHGLLNQRVEFEEGMCGTAMHRMLDATTPRHRQTPSLFGAGLLDRATDVELKALAEAGTARFPEVTGRVATTADGEVARFGWKGQTATLAAFVDQACETELGLDDGEISASSKTQMLSFVATLPPPEAVDAPGAGVFDATGCTACHAATVGPAEGAYTDLLLHDMGPQLSSSLLGYGPDTRHADAAEANEWRTPPLWGVATSAPYLHDGRAATLSEAIEQHGGEAEGIVAAYTALPDRERAQLLGWLKSLD